MQSSIFVNLPSEIGQTRLEGRDEELERVVQAAQKCDEEIFVVDQCADCLELLRQSSQLVDALKHISLSVLHKIISSKHWISKNVTTTTMEGQTLLHLLESFCFSVHFPLTCNDYMGNNLELPSTSAHFGCIAPPRHRIHD